MVEYQDKRLNRVFQALADPTRRAILADLASGPRTVSQVSQPFAMSLAAVSKHLNRLEHAGLVSRTGRGRERWCALEAGALAAAHAWLEFYESFWNERLDALDDFLHSNDAG